MQITGYGLWQEQNNRYTARMQELTAGGMTHGVAHNEPVRPVQNNDADGQNVGLDISDVAYSAERAAKNAADTATDYAPTSFSTTPEDNETGNAATRDNSDVLNKYRFFVPTSHYEDADGAVRRIFG